MVDVPDGDVEAAPIGRSRWQAPHHAQPTKNVEFPSHVLRVALDVLRDLAVVEGLRRSGSTSGPLLLWGVDWAVSSTDLFGDRRRPTLDLPFCRYARAMLSPNLKEFRLQARDARIEWGGFLFTARQEV